MWSIKYLKLKTKVIKESELNCDGESTERLVNICKNIDADTYVSGIGGKNYIDEKLFHESKINLVYQNYEPIIVQTKSFKKIYSKFIYN